MSSLRFVEHDDSKPSAPSSRTLRATPPRVDRVSIARVRSQRKASSSVRPSPAIKRPLARSIAVRSASLRRRTSQSSNRATARSSVGGSCAGSNRTSRWVSVARHSVSSRRLSARRMRWVPSATSTAPGSASLLTLVRDRRRDPGDAALTPAATAPAQGRASGEEVVEGGDHGIGRFLHQPVARAGDDLAANVGRYQSGLLDEEVSARLLAR